MAYFEDLLNDKIAFDEFIRAIRMDENPESRYVINYKGFDYYIRFSENDGFVVNSVERLEDNRDAMYIQSALNSI